MCKVWSKLTIKTPDRCHVILLSFSQTQTDSMNCSPVSIVGLEQVYAGWHTRGINSIHYQDSQRDTQDRSKHMRWRALQQ